MKNNKLLRPTFFSKEDINNPKNLNIKEIERKLEKDKNIPLMKPTFFKDCDVGNPKKSDKKEGNSNIKQRKHL